MSFVHVVTVHVHISIPTVVVYEGKKSCQVRLFQQMSFLFYSCSQLGKEVEGNISTNEPPNCF